MTVRKYIIGSLIAVAAAAIIAGIVIGLLWLSLPLKQTGSDRIVNAVNSMYSNVVFHDSAEYGNHRISAFTCDEDKLGGYLIDNDGGGSGGASDEPECMVMFAADADDLLIGVVDRGNAVKMDFKAIRCNDDGTEHVDRSETFRMDKTGISAYIFAVPNAYAYERTWRLVYTIYDKDGNVILETADK